ncbi:threonine/serine exporter family protein [Geodermatophilus sp. YIM 151500]|uniref:threonine/serine ThrE exporter family protein n=1 Tax=Geodermatophilus sp. YIM 151500 TaxID=2984531 RepID=UPI0021E376A8|nr:threonine/serine exporter family protein [Geodermatophilus sp. YIM 151500]MCV2488686.1 threonine/serine exporter family protein [Geodermatophilus sp. YIM 151500]
MSTAPDPIRTVPPPIDGTPPEPPVPALPDDAEEDSTDRRSADRTLELALRIGDVLLSGGASVSEVTATCTAVAEAAGLERVECDITFTSISISGRPGPDAPPVSGMRLVHERALDYTRVTGVHNIVTDLVDGRIDRAAAERRLRTVVRARHPYRRGVVTLARAALAGSVAVLLGAGPVVTAVALAATVVIDLVIAALARAQLPAFYQNAAGGAVATAAALALVAADTDVQPSLVVAAGIVLLLPGVTLVGAVQDAITGSYVTASARAFETFLLAAGIVAGIAVALSIGVRAGLPVRIGDPPIRGLDEVPVQLLAAAVVSAAFAVSNYAPRRTVPAAGVAGALGWGVFAAVERIVVSPTLASAAGAVVIGMGGYALAGRQRVPTLVYVAAGIIPLLPGLTIYRGMRQFVEGASTTGITLLGQAIAIGLALAAGAILGEYVAQAARRGDPRHLRRLAGLRTAGRRHRRPHDHPAAPAGARRV